MLEVDADDINFELCFYFNFFFFSNEAKYVHTTS